MPFYLPTVQGHIRDGTQPSQLNNDVDHQSCLYSTSPVSLGSWLAAAVLQPDAGQCFLSTGTGNENPGLVLFAPCR